MLDVSMAKFDHGLYLDSQEIQLKSLDITTENCNKFDGDFWSRFWISIFVWPTSEFE